MLIIIDLPKSAEELKRRMSLANDEISIEKVDFRINLDFIRRADIRVDLPKNNTEMKSRIKI